MFTSTSTLRPARLQVGQEPGRGFRVGEVGGDDLRLDLVGLPQLRRQRLERIALARHQHQPAAVGGKAPRQFQPNA